MTHYNISRSKGLLPAAEVSRLAAYAASLTRYGGSRFSSVAKSP